MTFSISSSRKIIKDEKSAETTNRKMEENKGKGSEKKMKKVIKTAILRKVVEVFRSSIYR